MIQIIQPQQRQHTKLMDKNRNCLQDDGEKNLAQAQSWRKAHKQFSCTNKQNPATF
jgi:hypothetical protein